MTSDNISKIINLFPEHPNASKLLYRATTDGWKKEDFWARCGKYSNTLTIIKSSAGRVFLGFTQASWNSYFTDFCKDENAFIYSTELDKIYRVTDPYYAIFSSKMYGPSFGGYSLLIEGDPMNKVNGGRCSINGAGDGRFYNIPGDNDGNNEVTGEGRD